MIQPFTKIVVDKKEEAKFRRRVLSRYPYEHIEAIWGKIHGETLYIHAFMAMDHKVTANTIFYEDHELDFHEDDAKEIGLELLGTIHSHPDTNDNRFGDADLEKAQESQECVMGVIAIQTSSEGKKLKRRRTIIAYWPTVRPLQVVRKEWDGSTSNKRPRKAGAIARVSLRDPKRGRLRKSSKRR